MYSTRPMVSDVARAEMAEFLGGARNKAGMPETSGLERQKIDEIIQEVSKGSKFYEYQQKRETKITEKIEKLLAKKAQLQKMFARDTQLWAKNVKETEAYIVHMDSQRDLTRTIVCVDMDAFYAAVETLDHPEWARLPMAVGGSSMLCTANYEARKYGVVSAMPGYIAMKLCPKLLIVPLNFEKYKAAADKFHQVFRRYDPNFSHFSLDEATLDITEKLRETSMSPNDLISQMRREVFDISGLTCSAGISCNKLLAKIASNINKPNGQFYLPNAKDDVIRFIRGIKLGKINGIGKVTAKILQGVLGATIVNELWEQRNWIRLLFSEIQSEFLLCCSLGIGSSSNFDGDSERQSISTERTFSTIKDISEMIKVLQGLCEELAKQIELEGLAGKNITIKMKDSNFAVTSRAKTLPKYIWTEQDLFTHARELLFKNHPPDLRLLGVKLGTLESIEAIIPEESIDTFLKRYEDTEALAKCPICLKPIPGATEIEASEQCQRVINEHIDTCLARNMVDDESNVANVKSERKVQKRPAQGEYPTLDSFFKKSKRS